MTNLPGLSCSPETITILFSLFHQLVTRNPRLRFILRSQFPRQRSFFVLLQSLTASFRTSAVTPQHADNAIPRGLPTSENTASFNPFTLSSKGAYLEGAWASLDVLQKAVLREVEGSGDDVKTKKWCMRRGCKNDGDKNCSRCHKMAYCSVDCQTA